MAKSGSKRIRNAKPNKNVAIGIIESSLVRAQKAGVKISAINIPDQMALGVVIDGAWCCVSCIRFQFGDRTPTMKCKECEGK